MKKEPTIKHAIQKAIIRQLSDRESASFSDLRPPQIDTNLFSYHLKVLVRHGLIEKIGDIYRLGLGGLRYASTSWSETLNRPRPELICTLVVQNSDGDILLQRHTRQPFINTWTLPGDQLYSDDANTQTAVRRVVSIGLGLDQVDLRHAGEAYVRVYGSDELLAVTMTHIYRFESDDIVPNDDLIWVQPHKLHDYRLAPGVESIIARSFFNDNCFFEEFREIWVN